MEEDFDFQESTSLSFLGTPVHDNGRVCPGEIVCHPRWKGSNVTKGMQGHVRIRYEEEVGVVDFHPAPDTAVIYITEGDLVAGSNYRRKLAKLRKAERLRGVIFVDKTPMTEQFFLDVQKFVVMELGFALLFVSSNEEAGKLLIQMVNEENKPHENPFCSKPRMNPFDDAVLLTVKMIPGLGEVKAKALLSRFGSIHGICNATFEELTRVVGQCGAQNIQQFLEAKCKK